MDISSRQIIISEHVIFDETRIYDAQKKDLKYRST